MSESRAPKNPFRFALIIAVLLNLGVLLLLSFQNAQRAAREAPPRRPRDDSPLQDEGPLLDRARRANGKAAVDVRIVSLDLRGLRLTDEDIATIKGLREVRTLNLSRSDVRDDQLPHLLGLLSLREVDLSHTGITDAGLKEVEGHLHKLARLDLQGTRVSDEFARAVQERIRGASGNSVCAKLGKFVLIRTASERVALKFTTRTRRGDGGVLYVWYGYGETGKGGQVRTKPVERAEGEVFEKYRRFVGEDGKNWVEDDGGDAVLRLGRLHLRWSSGFFVYFPNDHEDQPEVEIALTSWERIEDVDFSSHQLTWHRRQDEP